MDATTTTELQDEIAQLKEEIAVLQQLLNMQIRDSKLVPIEEEVEVEEKEAEPEEQKQEPIKETPIAIPEPINKTSKRKKKQKKTRYDRETKVKNGYAGIPYEKQENTLPEHPTLYANHPNPIRYSIQELNRLLPDGVPVNMADKPFVVMGFITPRRFIKQVEMYRFEQFVRRYPFMKSSRFMYDGMSYMGAKYGIKQTDVNACYDEVMRIEMRELLQFGAELEYDMFIETYQEELDANFKKLYGFQPMAEGLKLFGAFATEKEADDFIANAKSYHLNRHLRLFNGDAREIVIYDPSDRDAEYKKYANHEVAQMMSQCSKNGKKRVDYFQQRMKRHIKEAYDENKILAERTNQKLTMEVDDQGNIIYSKKREVLADLERREVKPTAPTSAELSAAGAKGGMVNVTQCIEKTDLQTGITTTEMYEGKDATYSKF